MRRGSEMELASEHAPPDARTSVDVHVAGRLVARMWRTGETVTFRYTDAHVSAGGRPVAFSLPVSRDPVRTTDLQLPPFFAGLLPEGDSRRRDIQRAFHLAEGDELGLLAIVGADMVGDVQVVPTGAPLPSDVATLPEWDQLVFRDLWSDLSSLRTRAGLPGVQPKMSAHSRSLAGGATGPVILKFPIPGWNAVLENELLFMRGAALAKLPAAHVDIVTDATGAHALAVTRFDRTVHADGTMVRHAQEDASQVLGLRPGQKYDPDARTVIAALADRCGAPPVATRDLFLQLAYSYVIGNNDLHAKNVSIRCPAGTTLWSVTPAYDVLHTWPYEGDHSFVPAIRPDGPHDAVTLKWWLTLANDVGLPDKAAQRVLTQVATAAHQLVERALAADEIPEAISRDIRRVVRRRTRDIAPDA